MVGHPINILLGLLGLTQGSRSKTIPSKGRRLQIIELPISSEIKTEFQWHHLADVGRFRSHDNFSKIFCGLVGRWPRVGRGGGPLALGKDLTRTETGRRNNLLSPRRGGRKYLPPLSSHLYAN